MPLFPETFPDAAMMALPPGESAVATPLLVTLAALGFNELQTAELVMSCVELSVLVAVAVNCCVAPEPTETLAGVTAMELTAPLLPPQPADINVNAAKQMASAAGLCFFRMGSP
jgi:hypothetical protein